jgi:hypothetical protein
LIFRIYTTLLCLRNVSWPTRAGPAQHRDLTTAERSCADLSAQAFSPARTRTGLMEAQTRALEPVVFHSIPFHHPFGAGQVCLFIHGAGRCLVGESSRSAGNGRSAGAERASNMPCRVPSADTARAAEQARAAEVPPGRGVALHRARPRARASRARRATAPPPSLAQTGPGSRLPPCCRCRSYIMPTENRACWFGVAWDGKSRPARDD